MRLAVLLLALVLYPLAVSAAPVAPEDLFKFTFLSSPAISPDGTHVLVEASRMNGRKDTYDRTIELVEVSNGQTPAQRYEARGRRRFCLDAG